jgi:hypothetical protein
MAALAAAQRDRLRSYADQKFRAALIGQHLMRMTARGTAEQFLGQGAVAFNYLLRNSYGVRLDDGYVMPQRHLWDMADVNGRGILQSSLNAGATMPQSVALAELGFPRFVQDSVKSPGGRELNRWDQGDDLKVTWFWIGFMLDPSMFRVGRGGATQGGEYMNATLASEGYKLFIHDAFSQAMRATARTLPETGFQQNFEPGYVPKATEFYMGYYLIQYHPGGNGILRDDWVTADQKALYTRLVNNTHRMYLLLYADALSRPTGVKVRQIDYDNFTARMRTVFNAYEPQFQAQDDALIQAVKVLGGY